MMLVELCNREHCTMNEEPDITMDVVSPVVKMTKQPFLKRGQGAQRRLQYTAQGKQYVPKGGFVYNTGNAEDDPNNRPSKTFLFKLAKINNAKQAPIREPVSQQPSQPSSRASRPTAAQPKRAPNLQVSTFTRLQPDQRTITAAAVPDGFDRAVLQEVINHSQQRFLNSKPNDRATRLDLKAKKDALLKEETITHCAPQPSLPDTLDQQMDQACQQVTAPTDDLRLAAAELHRQRAEVDKERATLCADRALFEKHKARKRAHYFMLLVYVQCFSFSAHRPTKKHGQRPSCASSKRRCSRNASASSGAPWRWIVGRWH